MDSKQKIIYTKSCLEFLDYKCVTPDDKDFRIYEGKNSVIPSMVDANFNDGFLNNWNWIMEVVEAIQKIIIKDGDEFCIEFYEGLPKVPKTFVSVGNIKTESTSPREAVVQAINQFLIWYEQNKTI